MKRILIIVLAVVICLSFAACGDKSSDNGGAESAAVESKSDSEPGVCTPEAYDEAIAALNITTGFDTMPTYDDVAELFGGVDGAEYTEMEYEGYSYYSWSDGKRTAIVTFEVSGGKEIYFAITGDIM